MASNHEVKQGEYLAKIAAKYGFPDWHRIWEHPKNAALKTKRQNPDVLNPGDVLYIPDKTEKREPRPTTQIHVFQITRQKVMVRIVLEDLYERPVAGAKCLLRVGDQSYPLTADGSGQIEQEILTTAEMATLTIQEGDTHLQGDTLQFRIGHLDPVDTKTGQRARLINLGYLLDAVGGEEAAQIKSAMEEFQCDNGLMVDGVCGPQTQSKLKEVHGC